MIAGIGTAGIGILTIAINGIVIVTIIIDWITIARVVIEWDVIFWIVRLRVPSPISVPTLIPDNVAEPADQQRILITGEITAAVVSE